MAPFVAMDIPKASQLVPAVGPFLCRRCHFAARRFPSASSIAPSGSGSNRDRPASSRRRNNSALSRAARGSPKGSLKAREVGATGRRLPRHEIQRTTLCARTGKLRNAFPRLSVSMLSICLARAGLSARHATRARSSASRSISVHLVSPPERDENNNSTGSCASGDFRRHATAGTQGQHSRQRGDRPDRGLPDRQPWARLVVDDIGVGQLTGSRSFPERWPSHRRRPAADRSA